MAPPPWTAWSWFLGDGRPCVRMAPPTDVDDYLEALPDAPLPKEIVAKVVQSRLAELHA